jgi:hypothetical protein
MLRAMLVLRAIIAVLIAAAIGVALIPLAVLLDLRRGGSGWGLCSEGLTACRNSYFAGFELIGWIFAALFIILGMIAMCVRILRYLEERAGNDSDMVVQ